jgi:hypothetical protein
MTRSGSGSFGAAVAPRAAHEAAGDHHEGFHLDALSLGRDAHAAGGLSDDDEDDLAEPIASSLASPLHHRSAAAAASSVSAFTPAAGPEGGAGPPALPCAGYTRLWCSRGAEAGPDGTFRPVSLWRPVAPAGYAILGDVAQTGYDPPRSPVATYRADDPAALAAPVGYQLVWRDAGSGAAERVTLWQPVPPPGFAAIGCVAVPGAAEPERSVVRCVSMARVYASEVFGEATWRDGGAAGAWRCSIWQVDNDAGTFLARRAHSPPPAGLALGALLY